MKRKIRKIDQSLQERLIHGAVSPDDLPPDQREVARVLRAARASVRPGGFPHETGTVAAMVERLAAQPELTPSTPAVSPEAGAGRRLGRAQVVAVAIAATLTLSTGMAFAGVLPGPIQGVASRLLKHVGINVPDEYAGIVPVGTPPTESPSPTPTETPSPSPSSNGKGAEISGLAHSTPTTGGKGKVICKAASDGQCHAGQPPGRGGTPPTSEPPSGSGHSPVAGAHSKGRGHTTGGAPPADRSGPQSGKSNGS